MSDSDSIKVDSLDQAEKIILEHLATGENYRDIAQITFDINGTVKRFNPSQISKIKAKYEQNQAQNGHDADKSMVFKMFRKDKNPTDVVIETGLNFDYVKKAHEEFLEFEDKILIPRWFYDKVEEIACCIEEDPHTLPRISYCLDQLEQAYEEYKNYVYTCSICGKDSQIKDETLKDAQQYIASRWAHAGCI